MISHVLISVLKEISRPELGGCHIIVNEKTIECMSSDSARISYVERPLDKSSPKKEATIPIKAMVELLKILSEGEARIGITSSHLCCEVEDTILSSRLIDYKYPDFLDLIPKKIGVTAKINRTELSQALKRITVLAYEHVAPIKLNLGAKLLTLTISSPVGELKEELVTSYAGEAKEVGYNAVYLQDFVNEVTTENVLLSFAERKELSNAAILSPEGDSGYCYMMTQRRVD